MAFLINLGKRLKTTYPIHLSLILHPILHPPLPPPSLILPPIFYSSTTLKTHLPKQLFSSLESSPNHYFYETSDFEEYDDTKPSSSKDSSDLDEILHILNQTKKFSSDEAAMAFLQESGIQPMSSLVYAALWKLRKDWKLAFLAFSWAEKCSSNSLKAWNLMVWILGKQRRFDIAWHLLRDMHQSAVATREALLIMIKRYAAANDAGKAIKTFKAMDKFKITADSTAFYTLLHALCKHKNIEEAEELMLMDKKLFPLETESFNIILNGWCNIIVDVVEAKRVWREMSNCCITPNANSYTHMICCFSKVGNLFDSLRLYEEMKRKGWVPSLVVYNSLIYVLAKENCIKEAQNLFDMIIEKGLNPDADTYNSIIYPLCEAQKLEEARMVLDEMMKKGVDPTIGTYHALAEVENMAGTLKLINRMKEVACGPNRSTFLLLLYKFSRWSLPEKALKIWSEMKKYNVDPDSEHYVALIQGLITCGWDKKAREFFDEMKSRGFACDPKLEKLLKELEACNRSNGEGKRRCKKGDNQGVFGEGKASSTKTRRTKKNACNQLRNETQENKMQHGEEVIKEMIRHLR